MTSLFLLTQTRVTQVMPRAGRFCPNLLPPSSSATWHQASALQPLPSPHHPIFFCHGKQKGEKQRTDRPSSLKAHEELSRLTRDKSQGRYKRAACMPCAPKGSLNRSSLIASGFLRPATSAQRRPGSESLGTLQCRGSSALLPASAQRPDRDSIRLHGVLLTRQGSSVALAL